MVTADGHALAAGQPVPVPAGTDARVAAALFVSTMARRGGQDIKAMFTDLGRDDRRRMLFRANGEILQSRRQLPAQGLLAEVRPDDVPPRENLAAEVPPAEVLPRENLAAEVPPAEVPPRENPPADVLAAESQPHEAIAAPDMPHSDGEPDADVEMPSDLDALLAAEPPMDVDPDSVPAWPHFDINLLSEVHVVVNGVRHLIPHGAADPRVFAVGMAAAQLRRMGLARPVRATAHDPDGTSWPILIHPGGAATEAGPPEVPGEKGKKGRRRTDR